MTKDSDQVSHVETVEIRGLEKVSDGTMEAYTEVLGCLMHITFLRVRFNENNIQIVEGDLNTQDRYEDLYRFDPGPQTGFHTAELEGFDGEWVMVFTPFQR